MGRWGQGGLEKEKAVLLVVLAAGQSRGVGHLSGIDPELVGTARLEAAGDGLSAPGVGHLGIWGAAQRYPQAEEQRCWRIVNLLAKLPRAQAGLGS